MTALVLHTMLAVVVIAWAYLVAKHVSYHRAWLWIGAGVLVVVGYLAVVARYVFEGVPRQLQTVIGRLSGSLVVLASVLCLVLFALVSARADRPSTRSASGARARGSDEEPVIVPDDDAEAAAGGPAVSGQAGKRAAPRRALPPEGDEA